MLQYVELDGVDVTSYVLSYVNIDEWKTAISSLEIKFSTTLTDVVTPTPGKQLTITRGFSAVGEDYVFYGQITQRKPEANKITLVCKGQMVEAIKAGRTKSWDKDIDTEAGVGSEIFKSLCDDSGLSYSASSIVSTGTTDADKIVKFIQNDEDNFQKMNELAEIYGNRVIRFDNNTQYVHFEPPGYTIYPHTLVVGTDIAGQIKWKENMEQLINKVKILGATVYDTANETFAGPATTFTLAKTPEDTEVRDTSATGTLYVRGQKGVGTIGTDFDYYVEPDQKTITFSGSTSNVWVKYGTQVPMPIIVKNQTSIDTYGGANKTPHFKKFTFTDIKDINDAEARGRAIIDKYSTPFIEAQDVPIKDEVLESYGFIKVGDLVTIEDSFTGETNQVFVKIVEKSYPEPYDKITVGDEIWRTEDWQTEQMKKINLLFNELNKNEDIITSVIDIGTELVYENRYFKFLTRDITGDMIWNNFNYTWNSGTWPNGYSNAEVQVYVIQNGNRYIELFYDTDFKDASTTADWDTATPQLDFTTGEIAVSEIIHTTGVNIIRAKMIATVSTGEANLTFQMRVDGTNWETVSNDTLYTFTNSGSTLEWKISASDAATITRLDIEIVEV